MESEEKQEENVMMDTENIHNSLENKDISKLVEIICKKTNAQRQTIKESYLSTYGTELNKELDSKLSGNVKELIKGLMMTPEDFDANEIYLSIKGLGTDELRLSETIATRPSRHLAQVKERYSTLYGETLEKAIEGDTSGCYKKILIALTQGKRSDNPYPSSQKMKEIVEKLNGGEKGKIKEDDFVQYFGSCSYGEICTICRLYEKTYKESILDAVKNSFDKDTFNFFKIFLQYISDSGSYFAEKIHNFDEKDLTRIMISKSEVNMDEIRDAYKEMYKTDLVDDLKEKTEGDYQLGLKILAQK
jgi:hypothetical protein